MTAERWTKVKEIFADALEHQPADRKLFVQEAAGGDAQVLNEVYRMIAEEERETGLLSRPALVFARTLNGEAGPRFPPSTIVARRFRIVRFIAHGGMGEVYEAEDLELGERVALKTIRPGAAPDEDLLALLKKEVQLARRVTHPNVCRIYDLAQHDDPDSNRSTTLLSMELLQGHTLAEHLSDHGPFDWRDALPLIEQIGAGIQAAQDAGIIHGDLKPANVMLAPGPTQGALRAVVMDFGVALPAAQASSGGRRGGTPGYLAPEQAEGRPITSATDVYAFGVMIAEMLGAGRPPQLQLNLKRMPAAWTRILERCVDTDPTRRYPSVAQAAELLRSSIKGRWQPILRVAAVLALVAVGVGLAKRQWTAGNPVLRQLFAESPGEYVWSVSPDGRAIAETLWDTGDLAIRDVANGKVRRLTHAPGQAWGAIFSPDSRQLVYRWNSGEFRIIGADGKNERLLYQEASQRYKVPLDWSPDGKTILAELGSSLATIAVADGSSSLVDGMKALRTPRALFTPDGSGIAFETQQQDSKESLFDIHRISWSGVETSLVEHPANDTIIGWSPDHRKLIFSSDRSGRYGIWATTVSDRGAAGEAQELRPGAGEVETLGISRDGSLFYRLEAQTANVYTATLDLSAGRTTSPPKPIVTRFNGPYEYPNWSEDGTRLVFSSRQDIRNPELLIYTPANGATRKVPVDLSHVWRPQWYARSGTIVAIGQSKGGGKGHFRIDPDTGALRPLIDSKDLESTFEGVWSADGATIFNRYTDWTRGLFRLNVDTGERRLLYVPPPGVNLGLENLALSPDERMLVFHARNAMGTASLMLVPADGGEARALLTISQPEQFLYGSFTWTPDCKQILASRTKNDVSEIWRVPVDGSPPAKIEFPPMRVQSLRLNRDGKTIAFTNVKNRAEIWVFERFLK